MRTHLKIQDLIGEIAHNSSCRRLEADPLPSGVCFVRVTIGRRHFVLEYDPKEGAGVSENFADTPLFVGHDAAFDSLDEAIKHFKSLLADAERTEADYQPEAYALHDKSTPHRKS
jgi:hypothetical protein